MPTTVSAVDALQQYVQGVMDRAHHHANNVDQICLAIAGAVIWRKDGDLEVLEREGELKNVLWVRVNGKRYALSYNHVQGSIEVRERSTQGKLLKAFTNATSLTDVKQFFGSL